MANLCASLPSSSSSFTTSAASGSTRNTTPLIPFPVRLLAPFPRLTPFPATAATTTSRPSFEVWSQRAQAQKLRRLSERTESEEYASPEEYAKANQKREKTDRKKYISLVPLDQRWLFEEAELNGPDIWNTTWYPRAKDHVNTEKPWYIVDATDKILGRLASTIAIHIRGKNLATYTPSVDMGAFVIVVNAEKVAVSGKKRTQKLYRRHSGRPGGMTEETFDHLQQRIPERIIEHAVRGMLPKGRLGRALFNHLKVYKGPDHPHEAQKPVDLPIRDKRIMKKE